MGACSERSRTKQSSSAKAVAGSTYDYMRGAAAAQYDNYKEKKMEMAEAVLNSALDDSDT